MAGLLLGSAISAKRTGSWRSFWFEVAGLAVFAALLNRLFGFPFSSGVVAKGPGQDLVLASALYICMLLGMFAQYAYDIFEKPLKRRLKWDWGLFWRPFFASPIVFIPLLTAFQGAGVDLRSLTVPRLMIFCVAFQNGFFWRQFFDRKQREENKKS